MHLLSPLLSCSFIPRFGDGLDKPHWAVLNLLVLVLLVAWGTSPFAKSDSASSPADVSADDLISSARSEVRIIARKNHQVEEFRAGNNVFMLKVTPKNAPPYYIRDDDGSGNFQWRRGGPELERTRVPNWAVVRW